MATETPRNRKQARQRKPARDGRPTRETPTALSGDQLRLLVDSVQDYAIVLLDGTGRVLSWNPGAEHITGYQAGEIVGQPFSRFFHPDQGQRPTASGDAEQALQQALAEGRYAEEGWRWRKDGSRYRAQMVLTRLAGKSKVPPAGFALVLQDVTERRQAEETLRKQLDLLDLASDCILVRDLEDRITFWNQGAERLYGWKKEQVLGKVIHPFLQTVFPRPFAEIRDAFLRDGRWEGELVHTCADGRRISVASRWTLRRDEMGRATAYLEINNDITRRKQMEEQRTSYLNNVRETVAQLSSTGSQIVAATQQQAAGVQEQAAAVSQTVATVDEITQTSEQAAQRARTVGEAAQRNLEVGKAGKKAIDDSLAAKRRAQEQVEATAENILALAEQAQAIGEIIATVNDIAEQTNLLALNAAIEASRAGEYGRGFSVVAAEVKVLADQSKKATVQVRQILGEIQKATNKAVLSTEEVTKGVASAMKFGTQAGETLAALVENLVQTAQAASQIVASAGQQATGMNQINQAMKNIDQVAQQTLVATRQTEQVAQDLNAMGTRLSEILR
jgi:PAS domain S-box-containing protein